MTDMCEVGLLWVDLLYELQGFGKAEMRPMVLGAEGVEDEHFEIGEFGKFMLRYEVGVGYVGEVADAVTEDGKVLVECCDRYN